MRLKRFKLFEIMIIMLFAIFIFYANINLISAVTTCNDDQRILKLTASDNAYSALWNYSSKELPGFPEEICYNEIFSKDYPLTNNVQECISTNEIILINGTKDALGYVSYASYNQILQNYDLNDDGVLNVEDYQAIIKCGTGEETSAWCDVNGDGNVNAVDIQLVINCMNGLNECNENAWYPSFIEPVPNDAHDVFNDGSINGRDIQTVIDCALEIGDPIICIQADVNHDGNIDSLDIQNEINYILSSNPNGEDFYRVCYGDLKCNVREKGQSCNINEKLVLSLTQKQKSLMSKFFDQERISICCTSKTAPYTVDQPYADGLPNCFIPKIGYYWEAQNNIGSVSLWDVNGDQYNWNTTYWSHNPIIPSENSDLLAGFKPIVGYSWENQSKAGKISLWDASGKSYLYEDSKWIGPFTPIGNGNDGKLPTGFKPTVGYSWKTIDGNIRVTLWNMDGRFYSWNGTGWKGPLMPTGASGDLPTGFKPTVGYSWKTIDGNIRVTLWNMDGMFYSWNGTGWKGPNSPIGGNGELPSGFKPTVGYYEPLLENVVLFNKDGEGYHYKVPENKWEKINHDINLCENPKLIIEETSCKKFKTRENCENRTLLTDNIKSSIQAHSLIGNNFCFDKSLTYQASQIPACGTYTECGCVWDNEMCKEYTKKVVDPPACISLSPDLENLCVTNVENIANANCDVDEEYKLSWTSKFSGLDTDNPSNGCASGVKYFPCPIKSKLSFFNNYNIMISLTLIFMIYFFILKKRKREK